MKFLIFTISLFVLLCLQANAQSDTLIITLKSNQIDKIPISQIQRIEFENITAVAETQPGSANLLVNGNYPNPFSDQTSLEFEIAGSGIVEIIIYDNSGNQIRSLRCDNCQPGRNSLQWDCLDMNKNRVQNGVYYYEVRFGNELQSRKMILVK